jgi:hypothetical protein
MRKAMTRLILPVNTIDKPTDIVIARLVRATHFSSHKGNWVARMKRAMTSFFKPTV